MNFTKSLRKWATVGVALAAMTFGIGQASATVFTFTFSNGYSSGTGTLNATDNGDGSFTAVGGSGTETIGMFTYLLSLYVNPNAPSTFNCCGYIIDNQVFPAANPVLNNWGLFFNTTAGGQVNIWGTGPGTYVYSTNATGFNSNWDPGHATSFELTTVPEPLSLGLLSIGLIGIGAARRRMNKDATV